MKWEINFDDVNFLEALTKAAGERIDTSADDKECKAMEAIMKGVYLQLPFAKLRRNDQSSG